jgi:hypothetical protein
MVTSEVVVELSEAGRQLRERDAERLHAGSILRRAAASRLNVAWLRPVERW